MKRKEVTKLLLLLTLVNSIEGSHIVTNAADENLYMESQQSINSEEEKQKENGKKEFDCRTIRRTYCSYQQQPLWCSF